MENFKNEFLVKSPGGLLVYGLLIALIYVVTRGKAPVKTSFSCEGCMHAQTCGKDSCQQEGVEN